MIDTADFEPLFDGQSHPYSFDREWFPILLQQAIDERCALDTKGIPPIHLPAGVAKWDRHVTFHGRPILITGEGINHTTIQATRHVPFFTCYPADHGLPDIVTRADGTKALRLHGTFVDGYLNLSDVKWTDHADGVEVGLTLNSLPGEWDLRTGLPSIGGWLGGWNDTTGPAHQDITLYPDIFTVSGELKIRLFTMQDGRQRYEDFPFPVTPGVRSVVKFTGLTTDTRSVYVDGQFVGSVIVPSGQTRQPWEDLTLGYCPEGGWPEGWAIWKTLDGEIDGIRVFNAAGEMVCQVDLGDVDGLCVGVNGVLGQGSVIWRQGDYAGDVIGAGISGLSLENGTFGLYGYGIHQAKMAGISSLQTRYPLFLRGHSFQNRLETLYLIGGRNGVTVTQISDCSIYDAQIFGCEGFGVVAKDSEVAIYDSWFYENKGGNVLMKGAVASIENTWSTDEGQNFAAPYNMCFCECPTVHLETVRLYSPNWPTNILSLQKCGGGTLSNVRISSHPSNEQCIKVEGEAARKFALLNIEPPDNGVPLTNAPDRFVHVSGSD